ncbi:carbohydrate ABC transporter permease [Paenibacillus spongiae]|uniref:Carbohydrate ABC transporter permease n=1 Tax=Paenibacillus spongiae TaxID=2909671 RepID=A0ABY5SL17_9BACL|nr:carbohydrate ABC transporter permease [Paenibacillus spongiae]UVI33258.1 carbohydrate ABC transporter permease [Paenibacillus spongiae]
MTFANRRGTLRYHIVLLAFSFLMMYPVFWWIGASLKSNAEMPLPTIWPSKPMWENFYNGWTSFPSFTFTRFFANTLWLEFWCVLGAVLTTPLVAYGFARINFKLKGFMFALLLMTIMLPGQVTIVPQYIMYNKLEMVDSFIPLILPHFFGGGAFFVFLMVQFIRGIPRELDESAKIDGCSSFGIFLRIILPLIRPALVTVVVYTFLWSWDDFFGQLLYLSSAENYTVSVALRVFIDSEYKVEWGQLLAVSLVSVVPSILVFFVAQKHFVEGISTTGIKG